MFEVGLFFYPDLTGSETPAPPIDQSTSTLAFFVFPISQKRNPD